jgi:hypothetical protein
MPFHSPLFWRLEPQYFPCASIENGAVGISVDLQTRFVSLPGLVLGLAHARSLHKVVARLPEPPVHRSICVREVQGMVTRTFARRPRDHHILMLPENSATETFRMLSVPQLKDVASEQEVILWSLS